MFGYIYLIENSVNDKLYVGQTRDVKRRIRKPFFGRKHSEATKEKMRLSRYRQLSGR